MKVEHTVILDMIRTSQEAWSALSDTMPDKSDQDAAYFAGALLALNKLNLEISRRAREGVLE